jgi:hypothetical protein
MKKQIWKVTLRIEDDCEPTGLTLTEIEGLFSKDVPAGVEIKIRSITKLERKRK